MAVAGLAALCAASLAAAQQQHNARGEGGGGRGPAHGPAGAWRAGPPRGYDPRLHNGYWLGPRWYYGPPPGASVQAPGYRPGFAPWRPGAFLPPQYPAFVIDEYWRFHLRRPPYGYHWVQAGGEFLLVSISTGQIFDVVTGF